MKLFPSVIGFALTLSLAFGVSSAESSTLFPITNAALSASLRVDVEIGVVVWMPLGTMSFQPLLDGHAPIATFSNHVSNVVTVTAEEKMIRVTAPGMVAPVTDTHLLGNWPDGKLICHPVAEEGFTIDTKVSVSLPMCARCPGPAPTRNDSHFGPEAFHTVQRTSLFNSSQRAQV